MLLSTLAIGQTDIISKQSDTLYGVDNNKRYHIGFHIDSLHHAPLEAPHSPIEMIEPDSYVLINGLKVILIQNKKLPFVSYKLYFDYDDIILGENNGVDLIFENLWGKNGKIYTDKYLDKYKYRTGAIFDINSKSIYIEGLSKFKEKNLSIISDLTMQFRFTENQFKEEKKKIADSLYLASNNNDFIVDAVAKKLMFGESNPIGETYNSSTIDSIESSDVVDYYNALFKPNNAYLVVTGDISMNELQKLTDKYLKNYRKGYVIRGYYPQPYNLPQIEIDFIENYSSDSLSVWAGNVIEIKDSKKDWIFNKAGEIILFDDDIGFFKTKIIDKTNITEFKYNYTEYGKYFSIEYDVTEDGIDNSINRIVRLLNNINSNQSFDSTSFEVFKSKINETYIKGLTEPSILSNLYLMYYVTGFGEYLIPNLSEVIDTVSQLTISQSLSNEIKSNQLRIVISGKPQIAVPKLEKLGYKINYYDQFGNTTFPPSLDRAVPDSITVNYIMDKYITSLGGINNLEGIRKMLQWWVLDIGGNKLYVKDKYMLPHKRLSTFSNKNTNILKTVFNGEYGYVERSGEIIEIQGNDFLKLSMEKSIFPIIHYQDMGYILTLESQVPIKGEMCYKVRVEAPYGDVFLLYFNIANGMIVRREDIDINTGRIKNHFIYSDFKTFEDIVYPYKVETLINGKKAIMILTQIKTNGKNVKSVNFR